MKKTGNSKLIIIHLDENLKSFRKLKEIASPAEGWIHTIRTALNMSLRQLSARLGITPQGMRRIEQREKDGSITLKNLREAGNALDMQLVYGFIPKHESLEKMIEKKAHEIATAIVKRTSQSMLLEDQQNSKKRIEKAIQERTAEIKNEMPGYLWD